MNAKTELMERISRFPKGLRIIAAKIEIDLELLRDTEDGAEVVTRKYHNLKLGYSEKDLVEFLDGLNLIGYHEYTRAIEGFIWFDDGSWLQREWNECSAWWKRCKLPLIPKELLT